MKQGDKGKEKRVRRRRKNKRGRRNTRHKVENVEERERRKIKGRLELQAHKNNKNGDNTKKIGFTKKGTRRVHRENKINESNQK